MNKLQLYASTCFKSKTMLKKASHTEYCHMAPLFISKSSLDMQSQIATLNRNEKQGSDERKIQGGGELSWGQDTEEDVIKGEASRVFYISG